MLEYLPDKSLPILIITAIGLGALVLMRAVAFFFAKMGRRFHPGTRVVASLALFVINLTVFCPALEEVAFRGPLVLIFDGFGFWPWAGIITAAIMFGWMHVEGNAITRSMQKTNTPGSEMFNSEAHRKSRGCATFFSGLIFGYVAIKYQSLYAAVIAHAGLNAAFSLVFLVLPTLIFRKKLSNLAAYNARCDKCKWEQEIFAQRGNLEEVAATAYRRHDAAKKMSILPGLDLPICQSKRFTITDSDNREYSAVRGFPPLLSEAIDSLKPEANSESSVLRKIQFLEFLKKAVSEWERQNNGKGEISGNEPDYEVILAIKENNVLSMSKLNYHIEPFDDVWEISIQGERLKENKVDNTPRARFNVKYSFVIGEDDIENPEIIIHKLLQHF